jgi:hypothetical protein
MRFVVPLAASPLEFGSPGFPGPASSARGLSQTFDGLHLQTAHPFCFTQAPPMGFKEHELAVFPRGPDRSTRGTVPSWITRPGRASNPKTTSWSHHECMRRRPEPVLDTFTARKEPTCHSPQRLQADDAGGGTSTTRTTPTSRPAAPRTRRRHVTHHNACKQTMQEEGTSTGNGAQTNHGSWTPSPAATTPNHPNDNAGHPL